MSELPKKLVRNFVRKGNLKSIKDIENALKGYFKRYYSESPDD